MSSSVSFELFFIFLAFVAVVAFVALVFGVSEREFFRAASENTEQGRLPRKQ